MRGLVGFLAGLAALALAGVAAAADRLGGTYVGIADAQSGGALTALPMSQQTEDIDLGMVEPPASDDDIEASLSHGVLRHSPSLRI